MASRICWHCESYAHQSRRGDPFTPPVAGRRGSGLYTWFCAFQCDACGYGSLGMTRLAWASYQTGNAAVPVFTAENADITWIPQHALGRQFSDVPEHISDAASEAYSCMSIQSYRAAVLMARSVVEAVSKDQGVTKGR